MSKFFKYVDQCPNVAGSLPDKIMEGDSRDGLEFEALLISDKSKEITNAPIEIITVSSSEDKPENAEVCIHALAVAEVSESSGDEEQRREEEARLRAEESRIAPFGRDRNGLPNPPPLTVGAQGNPIRITVVTADAQSNPIRTTATTTQPATTATRIKEETERCGSSLAQLVQLPLPTVNPVVSMVRDTGGLEEQDRLMTPREEEIMRIHEDGIYQTERTGGLWITGRISPSSEPTLFPSVEMVDSGPELDELLRDSPDIWETSPALSPPISQETSNQLRTMTSTNRAMTNALQEVLEDSLPWLKDGSPQHEPNEVVQFDQLQDGDPRERESFGKIYRGYLRLRSRIEDLEAQLRSRGILWMSIMPLDCSAPPHGALEIIEELNRLRELRVIQRVEVIQQATRWARTRNNATTPGAL